MKGNKKSITGTIILIIILLLQVFGLLPPIVFIIGAIIGIILLYLGWKQEKKQSLH